MASTARVVRKVGYLVAGLVVVGVVWSLSSRSPVVREPPPRADVEADEPPDDVQGPEDEVDDAAAEAVVKEKPRAETGPAAEPRRHLRLEDIRGVTVVHFVDGKFLHDQESRELGDQLDNLVKDTGRKQLLLNLDKVEYLCSPALTRIVLLRKKVKADKGTIKLCCLSPDIAFLLRLTKVEQIFEIYPDQQSALDTF